MAIELNDSYRWKLIARAENRALGWFEFTKAMSIAGYGVILMVKEIHNGFGEDDYENSGEDKPPLDKRPGPGVAITLHSFPNMEIVPSKLNDGYYTLKFKQILR